MNDIIKKAVELAEGWWWKEDCVHVLDTPMHYWADTLPQTILDALAAQLVRQVDSIDGYDMFSEPTCVKIGKSERPGNSTILFGATVIDGPDRTMNTITAIVESKVLEGEK